MFCLRKFPVNVARCRSRAVSGGWGKPSPVAGSWAISPQDGTDPRLAAYEAAARAKQAEAAARADLNNAYAGSPAHTSDSSASPSSATAGQEARQRQPVAPASVDVLSHPPALMEVAQSDPGSVLTALLPSFRRRLDDMSGRAFANAVGTCALALAASHTISSGAVAEAGAHSLDPYTAKDAEDFLAAAFSNSSSGSSGSGGGPLRKLVFDSTDQALLLHAHVALQEYLADTPEGILPGRGTGDGRNSARAKIRLPRDIVNACLQAHNRQVLSLQGLYDIVTLQLRRLGLPYSYRKQLERTGYMTWLLLPCEPEAAIQLSGGWAPRRWGPGRVRGPSSVALWIEGEWNMLTVAAASADQRGATGSSASHAAGAIAPWEEQQQQHSLAHRLMLHNIAVCDAVGHIHITNAERRAWLGLGSEITDVSAAGRAQQRVRPILARGDCESLADLLRFLRSSLSRH